MIWCFTKNSAWDVMHEPARCFDEAANHQLLIAAAFLHLSIYLSREEGRGERERNINVWLPLVRPLLGTWPETQACALTGDWTGDPLVWRPALNPLSHTSQGSCGLLNYPNSFHGGIFKLNAKSDADSLLCLLLFRMPAPHRTHLHSRASTTPHPHWLV